MHLFKLALSFLLFLAACGGSVAGDVCNTLSECNALGGDSVSDCQKDLDTVRASLPDEAWTALENAASACLKADGCAAQVECLGLIKRQP